jgi:hypothetical protein
MERVADLRLGIKDLDEARCVFDHMAMTMLDLAKKDAAFEKRIATLKTEHAAATCKERALMGSGEDLLAHFIEQHKDQFADPRKVKTSMGSFGLQAVSELVIENQVRLERFLVENKIEDCFELAFRTIKTAIRKRLEVGEKIPGAKIVSGDTAVYKVDKALVDQARANAD